MEKAIKKAIEGGWKHGWEKHAHIVDKNGIRTPTKERRDICDMYRLSEWDITSDPLFWQALGKACGWGIWKSPEVNASVIEEDYWEGKTLWLYHWHRFIDHLAEEKDAESFFNELLK